MSESIDRLVDQISKYLDLTGDFVLEQAPDVIHQIAQYGFWSALLNVLVGVTMIGIATVCFFKFFKYLKNWDDEVKCWVYAFISGIFMLAGIVIFFESAPTAIKAKVAPKLYVLDWCLSRGKR